MGMESFSMPPSEDESRRVNDPAKAEEMAHAAKFNRDVAADIRMKGDSPYISGPNQEERLNNSAEVNEVYAASHYDAALQAKQMSTEILEDRSNAAYKEAKRLAASAESSQDPNSQIFAARAGGFAGGLQEELDKRMDENEAHKLNNQIDRSN